MMIIKCKDDGLYGFKLKKCGRNKRIFWDEQNRPYYNRGTMRTYLDYIMRLSYPYFYDDKDGKLGVISGYEYIGCGKALYVELLDGGEAVQLWEVV